jgi:hypothetical protein
MAHNACAPKSGSLTCEQVGPERAACCPAAMIASQGLRMDIPLPARACTRGQEIIEEFRTVKIGSGIRHPLGRFCTPKRSKSARQMRTKSKLAKIVFHHHLWLGKARECSRLRSAMARGTKTLYDEQPPIRSAVASRSLICTTTATYRIAAPSERDFQRIEKYQRAIDLISRLPA